MQSVADYLLTVAAQGSLIPQFASASCSSTCKQLIIQTAAENGLQWWTTLTQVTTCAQIAKETHLHLDGGRGGFLSDIATAASCNPDGVDPGSL